MPKIINNEILDRLRATGNLVDDLLDKEIEKVEAGLPGDQKGLGNAILSLFVRNGNRTQLDEETLSAELFARRKLDRASIGRILGSLTEAGILRKTTGNSYEIANNLLARRAHQKVEAENRVLRVIEATIRDRMARDQLLDRQYLDYITPSLDQLELTDAEWNFVARSRKAIRRRRMLVNLFLFFIFLLLSALTILALRNAKAATDSFEASEKNRLELKEAYDELQKAQDEAERQRDSAQVARARAEIAQLNAEMSAMEALRQKDIADSLRLKAEEFADSMQTLQERAIQYAQEMERLRRQAQDSTNIYNELRQKAQENERVANRLRQEAVRLNKVISSWNVAVRSQQVEDKRLRALLAMEAYRINRDNPEIGNPFHPSIVKALHLASKNLNEGLEFSRSGVHRGAIRDIVADPRRDVFYTTGSDGTVRVWKVDDWNLVGRPDMATPYQLGGKIDAVNNCLALSPDGNRLIVAGESGRFLALDTRTGNLAESLEIQSLEEIFDCGYTLDGGILGLARNTAFVYYADFPKVRPLSKSPSRANAVVTFADQTVAYSFSGRYHNYAYELHVDAIVDGRLKSEDFFFFGTPNEVSFGELTAAALLPARTGKGLAVFGFNNGRLLMLEADIQSGNFAGPHMAFKQHPAAIADLAFSPDGKLLAVAGYDGTVSVWDLAKYKDPSYQPVVYDDHSGWAMSVAFSNKSDFLLVGCQDGSLYFWNLQPDNYAGQICSDLRNIIDVSQEEQRKLDIRQSKEPMQMLNFEYDEMTRDEYRRFFGEPDIIGRIKVCN